MVESKLDMRVNTVVRELMVVTQLSEYAKLHIGTDGLEVQEWSYFQWMTRKFNGDKREQTKQRIIEIYDEACSVADSIMKHVDLNIVLVPNKWELNAVENRVYTAHRHALDLLFDWMTKSLPKLRILHQTTYNGKEMIFLMIEHKTRQKLDEISAHTTKLNKAYATMNILSPLAATSTADPTRESDAETTADESS